MRIDDAIKLAARWVSGEIAPPADEPNAFAFAYALWMLSLERDVALQALADRGFDQGPLNIRIQVALSEVAS